MLRKDEDSHSRSSLFSFWGWMNLKLRDENVQWMWVLKGQREGERTSEEELHHHCGWDDTWNLSFNSFFSFFTSPPISFGLARSLFLSGPRGWLQSEKSMNTSLVKNIRCEQPTQLDYHTSTDWTVKFASSSFLPFALTISSGRFPSLLWSNTSTEEFGILQDFSKEFKILSHSFRSVMKETRKRYEESNLSILCKCGCVNDIKCQRMLWIKWVSSLNEHFRCDFLCVRRCETDDDDDDVLRWVCGTYRTDIHSRSFQFW